MTNKQKYNELQEKKEEQNLLDQICKNHAMCLRGMFNVTPNNPAKIRNANKAYQETLDYLNSWSTTPKT